MLRSYSLFFLQSRRHELLGPAGTAAGQCGGEATCPFSVRGRQALAEGMAGLEGGKGSTSAVHNGIWAADATEQLEETSDEQHEIRGRQLDVVTLPWALDGFFLNKPG